MHILVLVRTNRFTLLSLIVNSKMNCNEYKYHNFYHINLGHIKLGYYGR